MPTCFCSQRTQGQDDLHCLWKYVSHLSDKKSVPNVNLDSDICKDLEVQSYSQRGSHLETRTPAWISSERWDTNPGGRERSIVWHPWWTPPCQPSGAKWSPRDGENDSKRSRSSGGAHLLLGHW